MEYHSPQKKGSSEYHTADGIELDSVAWQDFIRQLGRIQFPLLSHFAMASRKPGTTAWSFTGPMPGMPSASASELGLLERKNGKRKGVWVSSLDRRNDFQKTPSNKKD